MLIRAFAVLSLILAATTAPVIASKRADTEPVLRLRLNDPVLNAAPRPFLRPRFNPSAMTAPSAVSMPAISIEEAGRVGKFAYVSTPHPNVVIAVGATDDAAEVGRQIDRAITNMASGNGLYQKRHDRAPFIGLGVRTGQQDRGWAMNATIGAGLMNASDAARLSEWKAPDETAGYAAETRANVQIRYRF